MWTALRIGVLGLGVLLAVLASRAWQAGTPPAWSLFAPTVQALVIISEPRDELRPDGEIRHWPHIEVAWPPGDATNVVVEGLLRPKNPFMLQTAESIVENHPVGQMMTVRVVDGQPFADRRDLRDLTAAFGFSIFSLPLILGGILTFTGLPRRAKKGEAT